MSQLSKPSRFGIRQKMLAILLTILLLALGTSGWLTLHKQEQDLYEATQTRGQEVVKHAAQALALYAVSYDYHSMQILLDEIITSPNIIHTHVTSAKGNIMATAGPIALEGDERPTFVRSIRFDDRSVGELTVQLDTADIVRRVTDNRNDLLLRELILIVTVALGEFIALSYFIARPVSVINKALEQNVDQQGRIRHKIPIDSKDEFGRLSAQFNLMREQLNHAQRQLHTRIEAADARLLETNQTLLEQSEALKNANQRLTELSLTDVLTGLYNRRHFEDVMTAELADEQSADKPCSLLIMDIDHFKQINDTYGHAVGDDVLRHFAKVIVASVRQEDIPCRIGGEEFVVACRHTSKNEANRLAERLRQAAEFERLETDGSSIGFTISIGVVTIDHRPSSLDVAFKRADQALYFSKQNGRNRVSNYADMGQKAHQA